ncbi:Dihydrolipoyllysine-residue acetyltransferase component of pyruvate dehydrogenase complex [Buchnera aphidicola (Eriosoma grossulariae)]|uniref:2-oxo acid dehydrogenase subunit E2 n=1 Tax=Buchnera aphidicola TaxID=9 RepID=UPI003463BF21
MTIEIKIPDIGVDAVEVIDILVKIGDSINLEQSLIVVEGDKTSMEIPSSHTGVVTKIKVKIGDQVNTNSVIMLIEKKIDQNSKKIINESNKKLCFQEKPFIIEKNIHDNFKTILQNNDLCYTTPLIRKLAREKNIDLSCIQGTGRKNRIIKEDLDKYIISKIINIDNQLDGKSCSQSYINEIANKNSVLDINIIKLNKIQVIAGRNLLNNWKNIPHVTHFDEVDVTNLDEFRKKYNLDIIEKTKRITLLSFLIKIIIKTLEYFPKFNSSISVNQETIELKKYINIGIAVDTSEGLLVPVLKNIQDKNILEISDLLSTISKKARSNKLLLSDLQNGTFTISNLGGVGSMHFTPIINSPEVAILGVSKCFIKSVWIKNSFQPRLILPLSLSYDHRVINGVEAAKFINFITKYLNDIRLLTI